MRRLLPLWIVLSLPLVAWGDPAAPRRVDDLLRDMGSDVYQTRRKAVLASANRGDPLLLDRLLVLAATDAHPNIRGYAAEVLGTYRDDRILPVLLALAESDRFPSPRNAALEAMGRLGDPRAWPPLEAALADVATAPYAALGLAHAGRSEAWDAICAAYRRGIGNAYVGELIPKALFELDPARAEPFLLASFAGIPNAARHTLVRLFRDHPSAVVRTHMTALLEHENAALRRAAIQVLGRAGDAETTELLLTRLAEEPLDCAYLARALGEIGDARAAPGLERALAAAAEGGARAAIAEALMRLDRPSSVGPLIRALDAEGDPLAKVVEIRALAVLGSADARAAIARRVSDPAVSHQPRTLSSIRPFPWNVRVSAAALWALETLAEARPPFPVEELSHFPARGPSDWEKEARRRFDATKR